MHRTLSRLFQNPNYSFWFFLVVFLVFRNLYFFVLFFLALHYLSSQEDPNDVGMEQSLNVSVDVHITALFLTGAIVSVISFFLILMVVPLDILEYLGRILGSLALIPDRFDLCILSELSEQHSHMKIKWIDTREAILAVYFSIVIGYIYTSIFMSVYFNFLHRNYETFKVIENKKALYFLCFVTILAIYVGLERLYWPQENNCSAFYGLAFTEWFGLILTPYLAMLFWYLSLILYKNINSNKRKTRV